MLVSFLPRLGVLLPTSPFHQARQTLTDQLLRSLPMVVHVWFLLAVPTGEVAKDFGLQRAWCFVILVRCMRSFSKEWGSRLIYATGIGQTAGLSCQDVFPPPWCTEREVPGWSHHLILTSMEPCRSSCQESWLARPSLIHAAMELALAYCAESNIIDISSYCNLLPTIF